jgi:hypothetical protein
MKQVIMALCLMGCLLWSVGIHAQEALTAYFEIPNPRPRIGEPIEGVLVISYSDQIEVLQRPELPTRWGIFEIVQTGERETTTANGRIIERQPFTLVAWQTGDHALPFSEVIYRPIGTTDLRRYRLPDIFFSIPSVLTEESLTIRTDEAPISIPFLPVWAFFVAISLVGVISIGIFSLWRYYVRQNAMQTLVENPQDIFLADLNRLQAVSDDTMRYALLSHILRQYLRARYGILAHEMTNDEIIQRLKTDGRVTSYQIASLTEIFEHLTVGKFSTLQISHLPERLIRMTEAWVQNVHSEEFA